MAVTVAQVINALEKLAPKKLAFDFDNVGLQIGNSSNKVKKIVVTLEITTEVIEFVKKEKINMIICHHPFIFTPLKSISEDFPKGKMITELIREGISLYVMHTNYDRCKGGLNDLIAKKLELIDTSLLEVEKEEKFFKLVVFVPISYANIIKEALGKAEAGHIGNYRDCFFETRGQGSFLPLAQANPFMGKTGIIECVDEIKLETIVAGDNVENVINAVKKTHPYETPAFEIYELYNVKHEYGLGRIGSLKKSLQLIELAKKIKEVFSAKKVNYCGADDKLIKTVAFCAGSGSSYLYKSISKGADTFISCEFKHHEILDSINENLSLIELGHFTMENIMGESIVQYLRKYVSDNEWNINPENIIIDTFSKNKIKMI